MVLCRSGEGERLRSLVKVARAMIGSATTKDETTSSVHTAVPPVLHGVIASSMESSGNLCPTLPHLANQTFNLESFFGADRLMVE